jgi:hypothetical protein
MSLLGRRISSVSKQQEAGSKQILFFDLEVEGDMFVRDVGSLSIWRYFPEDRTSDWVFLIFLITTGKWLR